MKDAIKKLSKTSFLPPKEGGSLIGAIGLAVVGSIQVYNLIKNRKKKKK